MGVAIKHEESFFQDPSIRASLVLSGIFHLSVFLLSIVTFPLWMTKPADSIVPISVEIVDIADIAQTNKVYAPEKKEEPIEQPSKPIESKPSPPPPVEEEKPDVPIPAPLEKVKPPEEKPKPVEKKIPVKSKEKVDDKKPKDINSLLKNLAPEVAPKIEPQKDIKDVLAGTTSEAQNLPLGERMTMTEMGALNAQFRDCWNILSGAQNAEKIAVEIRLTVGPDRRVINAAIVDQLQYSTNSYYRAAADAALRAVRHQKCEVLNLPPNKYDQWKDMIFNFDPSKML